MILQVEGWEDGVFRVDFWLNYASEKLRWNPENHLLEKERHRPKPPIFGNLSQDAFPAQSSFNFQGFCFRSSRKLIVTFRNCNTCTVEHGTHPNMTQFSQTSTWTPTIFSKPSRGWDPSWIFQGFKKPIEINRFKQIQLLAFLFDCYWVGGSPNKTRWFPGEEAHPVQGRLYGAIGGHVGWDPFFRWDSGSLGEIWDVQRWSDIFNSGRKSSRYVWTTQRDHEQMNFFSGVKVDGWPLFKWY